MGAVMGPLKQVIDLPRQGGKLGGGLLIPGCHPLPDHAQDDIPDLTDRLGHGTHIFPELVIVNACTHP